MEKTPSYKWRLSVSRSFGYESYTFQQLPPANDVDSSYIHKPGDIDYSEIQSLSSLTKSWILYILLTGHVYEPKNTVAQEIASMILIDRQYSPDFLPAELIPDNWSE